MPKLVKYFAVIIVAAALSACTSTTSRVSKSDNFQWSGANKRLILVQPDVQLSEISMGGMAEPRADWTATARGFIAKDVGLFLKTKDVELVTVEESKDRQEAQLVKLHGAVGTAIQLHLLIPGFKLPHKGDALDWSLGRDANILRDRYNADYALFMNVRDSYVSAGRAAFIGVAALFGVGIPGGSQQGFVSLVDLRTGNIVWFNRLLSSSGDLRTEKPAKKTVENLLEDIPI